MYYDYFIESIQIVPQTLYGKYPYAFLENNNIIDNNNNFKGRAIVASLRSCEENVELL